MANPSQNMGFLVLDDFVCEAIHAPSVLLANPANQGRNEEMVVLEEVVFDASPPKQLEEEATGNADLEDGQQGSLGAAVEPDVRA